MVMRIAVGAILLLLVAGGIAAYGLGFLPPEPPDRQVEEVSPAAAASAEMKLAQLAPGGEETRITAAELTSLFRFRPEIWSVGILKAPTVQIAGDTVRLVGRIATADLPPVEELDSLRDFLPDSAGVEMSGTVRPYDASTTVLEIGAIEVAGMPIPERFYSPMLDRFGQGPEEGLPAGTFALPLPPGIRSARAEGGDLVLTP